jgi:hypothetical protein
MKILFATSQAGAAGGLRLSFLEHFHYYCDVVRSLCAAILQWNGRARFSFSAYTNSENAPASKGTDHRTSYRRARTSGGLLLGLALTAISPVGAQTAQAGFQIAVLSSRPDMVSGGDALVEVVVPQKLALDKATIKLNGQNVTSEFHPEATTHALTGLVTGLNVGANSLEVFPDNKGNKGAAAQLALTDYPITGPIFSGPQEQPFLCQTQDFGMPDGGSLGAALDANCSAATVVTYVYKSTEPLPAGSRPGALNLKVLPSMTSLPADVAMTTTTTGAEVPYVVRVETGTVNRSIYQFAVLDDPTAGVPPGPLTPPKAWNRRLLFSFGGGCAGGWYKQGFTLGSDGGSRGNSLEEGAGTPPTTSVTGIPGSAVIGDAVVGRGYAEAGSTLNVAGNSCNDVISAETMMMVKERFIKAYGKPDFTLGRGASGGSYQQNQITDRYPGLLDGIIPSMTFPDVQELAQMLTDSRLLNNYYGLVGDSLTKEQERAIAGVAELLNIPASAPLAGRINPTEYCPPDLPKEKIYNSVNNPAGVRCDIYDHNLRNYGQDPATGFARRPIDNVGVQYGLAVLNDGTITTKQFLDLNEKIGGYDSDGYAAPTRSHADPLALRAAYQSDTITYGNGGLGKLPIIDVRPYRDRLPKGDNHLKYHSFTYRMRLQQANGTYANDVMLTGTMLRYRDMEKYAIAEMDQWLTALGKDTSNDPILDKIARAKPADLTDSCWTPTGERIVEPQTYSGGECNKFYPTFPSPRMVAGGSLLASNILKCQLKPIDFSDYKVTFSEEEKARLTTIFPEGVCDWSKPGVEQQAPTLGTWHIY